MTSTLYLRLWWIFIILLFFFSSVDAQIIAHWRMDEIKNGKVIDLSENGNDASVVGSVKFVEGDYGKSLIFDGSTYIDCGNDDRLNLQGDFSIELWIRVDEVPPGKYLALLSKYGGVKNGWLLYRAAWDDSPRFRFRGEGSKFDIPVMAGHLAGRWRYLVVNHSSGILSVYIDGKKIVSKTVQGTLRTNKFPLLIGALSKTQEVGQYFKGAIREIIINGRGLSADEIKKHSRANRRAIETVVDVPESMYVNSTNAEERSYSEWLATMRSVDWRIPPEITLPQARKIVRNLSSQGFDTLFVGGWHRYIFAEKYGERNWWSAIPWDVYLRSMKFVKQACDEENIKLVVHLTANLALWDDYDRLFKGMATCDVETGEDFRWEKYYGYPLCPNNPEFKKLYTEKLTELIEAVDCDGLMIDETGFGPNYVGPRTCGCRHCKRLFKKQYGYEIPNPQDKAVWQNYSNPQWRAWIKFRLESINSWFKLLSEVINASGKQRLFTSCYGNPLTVSIPAAVGIEPESKMNWLDIFFYECEPLTPCSWRHVIAEGKYVSASGPTILFNPSASLSQEYFARILGMAYGWLGHQWPDFNQHRTVPVLWEKKWQKLWLGNSAFSNIAIVFSSTTRSLTGKYLPSEGPNDMGEYVGWAQTLLENHIPFDVVLERQLTHEILKKYATIILPDAAGLSSEQVDSLRQFVKAGGMLLATDESSLYDSDGVKLDNFALADVMGVNYVGDMSQGKIARQSPDSEFPVIDYPVVMRQVRLASAVALGVDEQSKRPLITSNRYEKGSCLYFAFRPGIMYRMPKVGGGWHGVAGYWFDDRRPEFATLMAQAVNDATPPIIKTKNVPVEIIVNPIKQSYKGYDGIMIHLVNCLGTRFEKYAATPTENDYEFINYPSVKKFIPQGEKMTFWIKSKEVKNVYLVSPDFLEVVCLDYEMDKDGFCKISVPDIGRYEIIYVQQSKKNLIEDIEDNLVSQMPQIMPFKTILTSER